MERENFSLDQFRSQLNQMIKVNNGFGRYGYNERTVSYTREEIEDIIHNGSTERKIQLSKDYFARDGFYRRILIYYATILKYAGILVPNPSQSKSFSDSYISKKYYNAVDFVDKMDVPTLCTNFALKTLIEGSYYGVLIPQADKKSFIVLDLPAGYCRTTYKDIYGNDLVEFNVTYFNTILDKKDRKAALQAYPKEISDYYLRYSKGKVKTPWILLGADYGIYFQLFDSTPLFLTMLPSVLDYDDAVKTEKARDEDEIKKIIVQKIPHLTDGALLFEPEEAEVMHEGAVGMMRGNKNVDILTTYADVDAIVSKTSSDTVSNNLEKMVNNIYYQSGTSSQLFASNSNLALATSIQNDAAMMMVLAHKFEHFITSVVNKLFANANISFKYKILPITPYNAADYAKNALNMANSGYSFIVPAVAMDMTQKDLSNIKDLENNLLNLGDKLRPLSTSYTQSGNGNGTGEVGAPEKAPQEKSPKTVANEESIDRTGEGGSTNGL